MTFPKSLSCRAFLLTVFLISVSNAQTSANPTEPAFPYTPSLDISSMDKSVDPCVDLYQYSCGGWQKKNPIPPDQTSWSVYGKLSQDNQNFLRGMLEQAGRANPQRTAVEQQTGD